MKLAPVHAALSSHGVRQSIVHTGQHYDESMSAVFFRELGMPAPDVNLEIGSASHAQQTAQIISRLEHVMTDLRPDVVLVYGDVNSTLGAVIVCSKMLIRTAHVEAGLRSFDMTMPEEVNRIVTDRLADFLFTPSIDGDENLIREGTPPEKIHFVGNVMIDTLIRLLPHARMPPAWDERDYVLATLHRPSNVDDDVALRGLAGALLEISKEAPILFPVHPRTRQRLSGLDIHFNRARVHLLEPLGYLEFLGLQRQARLVITDSGGVQEETTYLRVPCLTVRENTERPVTVTAGTNRLVGNDPERLIVQALRVLRGEGTQAEIPPLWDGRASERIAEILVNATAMAS